MQSELSHNNMQSMMTVAVAADRNDGHIFISYQWDAKFTVLRVRDKLRHAGFRVWIDEDDMCEQDPTSV